MFTLTLILVLILIVIHRTQNSRDYTAHATFPQWTNTQSDELVTVGGEYLDHYRIINIRNTNSGQYNTWWDTRSGAHYIHDGRRVIPLI